jgi:hypothetical protein
MKYEGKQIDLNKWISVIFLISVMSIFFYGPLSITYVLDFTRDVSNVTLLAANLDFFLKVLLILFTFICLQPSLKKCNYFFQVTLQKILMKHIYILYFIVVVLLFLTYGKVSLIMQGFSREELILEDSASRLMWILSPLVTIFTAFSFTYKYEKKISVTLFFCLCIVSIYSLSRSQFLAVSFFILIAYTIKGVSVKSLFNLLVIGFFVVILMSIMTLLQGRAESFSDGVLALLTALFKYRSFSFYLSDYAIDKINGEYEQIMFPFFGVLIERFLSLFESLSSPIAVQSSSFVFDYVRLGPNIRFDANVLYPWWSWFYGVYGIVGIFVKFIFCFFILYLVKGRLNFCFIYFIFVLCFSGGVRHPLLDNSNAYTILSLVFLDLIILFYCRYNKVSDEK